MKKGKQHGLWGYKQSPKHIENRMVHRKGKRGFFQEGEKNHQWKGDNVGLEGLHRWVKRHLGTSNTCEHCGRSNLSGRQINWANKSHEYKRNLKDWIRLCVSCHKKYDYAYDRKKGRNRYKR